MVDLRRRLSREEARRRVREIEETNGVEHDEEEAPPLSAARP
jgi:hypothetical protein